MLPKQQRVDEIRRRLETAFRPVMLEVIDDSHKHIGHEGARDGRGHYTVHISAEVFRGQLPLAQHRSVYAALGELMSTDIHALAIKSGAPAT
ncbi:MAG: BolA family transcriptional regulator [Rhodanobacteraceae bacterium]|nr:BolA family transcriptional regulator [Rhodanobacteraceae bacterium]MBK7042593.1 BolA family transcriptional regulator [Rhodanobacteraceae bacterium]MBP9153464.1 BolA family transcriptional regulator [Xanthomonadales bacterium]HQW81930.1 BolA family protein [Pseudomonadota bacterium]